jgi:hypothetical protein
MFAVTATPAFAAPTPKSAPTSELGYVNQYANTTWINPDPHELNPDLKWPRSLAVFDAMTTESQVTSVLRAVQLPILGTRWRIDPAGARDEVTERVARQLNLSVVGQDDPPPNRQGPRFQFHQHLFWSMLSHRYGHMYFEKLFAIRDDGLADLIKLSPRMPRRIQRIDVGNDGELVSIKQNPAVNTSGLPTGVGLIEIPANRLVAYVNEQEPGDWIGRSLLRAAYKNWLLKDELLRTQAATIRRNGMGIPVYKGGTVGEDLTNGWSIAQRLRAGEQSGVAVPYGAMLTLEGVTGTLPDASSAIAYHDAQMARAVLAHFLNLGQQTGSWALGASFQDFFTLSLQWMAQMFRDEFQTQVVDNIVDINWGTSEPSPNLVFEPIGSQQPLTASVLLALRQAGIVIPDRDLEQFARDAYGLPVKTVPSPGDPAYPDTGSGVDSSNSGSGSPTPAEDGASAGPPSGDA